MISVAAQQQAGREEQEQAAAAVAGDEDKQEEEGGQGKIKGRLCAEARVEAEAAAADNTAPATKTKAARVCVDSEAREGMLAGVVTNVGDAPLCGASMRVMSPMGVGPHRHAGEGVGGNNHHHEAKRLSRAVPLFGQGAPPMAAGEERAFVVEVEREAFWLGGGEPVQGAFRLWVFVHGEGEAGGRGGGRRACATAFPLGIASFLPNLSKTPTHTHAAIYGLLVDPDYESCITDTTDAAAATAARRLVDASTTGAAGAAGGATNTDIRVAKREARQRRKEARRASEGLDHKLKKLKKVCFLDVWDV